MRVSFVLQNYKIVYITLKYPIKTMTSQGNYITEQRKENIAWLETFKFYKDEIKVLRKRLEEVASRNSAKDVKMQISHFENQFIINDEQIDEISHAIKENQVKMEQHIHDNPVAVEHRKVEDHTELRDKVNVFENIFKQLRIEFNEFLSKTM
jgi:hypothetical protein